MHIQLTMSSLSLWDPQPTAPAPVVPVVANESSFVLPPEVDAAVWRATSVIGTGWAALDAELPGGGWPCRSVTEVLQPQPSICEWRLLGPALRTVVASGQTIAVLGPPKLPHLPGLRHAGLDDHQFVWVRAETPAERLWVTEQLIKSNACGRAPGLTAPGPPRATAAAAGLRTKLRRARHLVSTGVGSVRGVGSTATRHGQFWIGLGTARSSPQAQGATPRRAAASAADPGRPRIRADSAPACAKPADRQP